MNSWADTDTSNFYLGNMVWTTEMFLACIGLNIPSRQKKMLSPPEKIPKFAPDRVQIIQAELGASLSDKRVEFFSNSNYIFATG